MAWRGTQVAGVDVGVPVTMRLQVGAGTVEVPGRIAWLDPGYPQRRYDFGVQLRLEIARAAMRQMWAEWVVGLIRTRALSREA